MTSYTSPLYAMSAFTVPKPYSDAYKNFLTKQALLEELSKALDAGANVVSIRRVVQDDTPASERQKNYIRSLCYQLNVTLPQNLDRMTRQEASEFIERLKPKGGGNGGER